MTRVHSQLRVAALFLLLGIYLIPIQIWAAVTATEINTHQKQQPTTGSAFFDLGELIFQTIGDNEQIPQGVVTALAQDRDGFIWIGTQFGLLRFDGYRFVSFLHDPKDDTSLSGSFIRSLWVAQDGRIWIGTFADGISVYNPATGRFKRFEHNRSESNSLYNNTVRALIGDDQGNIYAATDNGLNHIQATTGRISRLKITGCDQPLAQPRLRSLLLRDTNTLWVGSKTGLCRVSLPNGHTSGEADWQQPLRGQTESAFNQQNVFRLFQGADHTIWVGTTDHGAAFFTPGSDQVTRIRHRPGDPTSLSHHWVNGIIQPDPDHIWLSTSGGGITVVNANSGAVIRHIRHDPLNPYSINLDSMGALLIDASGLIWAGTWGNGLNRHNPHNGAFRTFVRRLSYPHSLSHEDVRSITELNNGQIWVGNAQTGIDIIDPRIGVVTGHRPDPADPSKLADGYVRVIRQTFDGSLWAGSANTGLHHFDPQSQQFTRYSKADGLPGYQVVMLQETANGQLWVGTDDGLALMDIQTRQLQPLNTFKNHTLLSGKPVLTMAYMTPDLLWVGTRIGLFVLNLTAKTVTEISAQALTTETLSDNYIKSLLVDSQGRLLVATPHGLDRLVHFDGHHAQFESLDQLVGRPTGTAGNLMEDAQGRIWNGYGWLDPSAQSFEDLGTADDWDTGTMWTGSYTKLRDGTLVFGGTKGLLLLRPERWTQWTYHPPVVISELAVNNQPVTVSRQLVLPPSTRSFSVEFAALDYTAPHSNRYAYQLVGYDDNWIPVDASKRHITYTRLPPGHYQLKIKGSNRKGQWSKQQLNLAVIQLPTWYETWWFRLGLLLLITTLLYLAYLWRIKELKQQQVALDSLVQSRTANISMLGTIGKDITSTLDLSSVLERVYKHVNELMGADVFVVGILDTEKQRISCRLAIEKGQKLPEFEYALSDTQRPAVWCVTHQKELRVNQISELTHYVGHIAAPVSGAESESLIYLPLIIDTRIIGCLTVQSFQPHAFSDNDVQMLRTIANYTAIALANADSVAQLESTFAQLQTAHDDLKVTQQQLVQQEKMAGLGRLVSGVAHEINTPLGIGITAGSYASKALSECEQKLASGKLTKDNLEQFMALLKESLQLLESNLNRAAQLVKNFKQVAVDQSIEELSTINLPDYLNDVLTSLHPKWKHTQVSVQTDFPGEARMSTYPGAIAQILTNLVDNAIKHGFDEGTQPGTVTISLSTSDEQITWIVSDDGAGMSDDTLSKVFEPFYTTRRSNGGTGLGMHIVFNIVTQKLKGTIECHSEAGQGCRYTIVLPNTLENAE
ncbi:two-component regulator propeller domain-containing protein [Pseudoalteromonas rubra]|uniref:two-component regulator propeller domain-containing protein n=1 Tax=Pseudoalteromonas rubra TaxID=43658 RepID=UPI00110950AE|nr:two-component regulator propeller domain-containing protein [Pseudoalteromonas rubra]